MTSTQKVINSLIDNGFQITLNDGPRAVVHAVGNEGEHVYVSIGAYGLCRVVVNEMVFTDHAMPHLVGECARLRRHVGMFE